MLVVPASTVQAQEMTERHIPVGAYPSLSGEHTFTGIIVAVDHGKKIITLEIEDGERNFRVTDDTKIWLDRSQLKKTTLDGVFGDIQTGLEAEVRTLGEENSDAAYWVKVQM